MSEKLKPCPYCNEKAKIIKETDHHGEYYNLGCSFSECIAADAFYTETEVPLEDAILRWNSRPIEDSLCDQLAACQKELAEAKAEIERLKKQIYLVQCQACKKIIPEPEMQSHGVSCPATTQPTFKRISQ